MAGRGRASLDARERGRRKRDNRRRPHEDRYADKKTEDRVGHEEGKEDE